MKLCTYLILGRLIFWGVIFRGNIVLVSRGTTFRALYFGFYGIWNQLAFCNKKCNTRKVKWSNWMHYIDGLWVIGIMGTIMITKNQFCNCKAKFLKVTGLDCSSFKNLNILFKKAYCLMIDSYWMEM